MPVLLGDFHHVVEARIIGVKHFGQAEIGALAGMGGDDVIDHDGIIDRSGAAHRHKFVLRAEIRIDVEADPVEIAINGRRLDAVANATGFLHWAGVNRLNADGRQVAPEFGIAQRREDAFPFARDDGGGIGGEPDRGQGRRGARAGLGIGIAPEPALAGIAAGKLAGIGEHRLAEEPLDILRIRFIHWGPV